MIPDRALATFETYAAACRAVGRSRITPERVRELYRGDDGPELSALDTDGTALAAAAAATASAAALERAALAELAHAWQGGSGSAAMDFVGRQCAAGDDVTDGLAGAAAVLRSLRARLAELTYARREATVRICDRRAAEHPVWLAQSRAVLAGSADPSAVDTVHGEVAPFVEVDIAGDWATAMVTINDAATAAYRTAAARLDDLPVARFEVPAVAPDPPGHSRPAPVRAPEGAAVPPSTAAAQPAQIPPAGPMSAGPMSAGPGFGAGPAPGLSPGLSPGFGAGVAEPAVPARPRKARKRTRPQDAGQDDPSTAAAVEADAVPEAEPEPASGAPASPPAAVEPVAAPPVAVQAPPLPSAPLPAEAGFEPRTPCEIAADELPQVGQ